MTIYIELESILCIYIYVVYIYRSSEPNGPVATAASHFTKPVYRSLFAMKLGNQQKALLLRMTSNKIKKSATIERIKRIQLKTAVYAFGMT